MDKCNTNIEFITESSIVDESSSNLELDADLFNALIENLNDRILGQTYWKILDIDYLLLH